MQIKHSNVQFIFLSNKSFSKWNKKTMPANERKNMYAHTRMLRISGFADLNLAPLPDNQQ